MVMAILIITILTIIIITIILKTVSTWLSVLVYLATLVMPVWRPPTRSSSSSPSLSLSSSSPSSLSSSLPSSLSLSSSPSSRPSMIYENIFRPGGNTGSGQIPAGGNQLLSHSCVFSKCGRLCRLRFWETVSFPIVGTGLERVKSPIWIFQTGFRNFTLQPHFGASTLFFLQKWKYCNFTAKLFCQ